jgi:hypothetical protein
VYPATNTLAHLATQPPEDLPYAKFEPAEWHYENVVDAIGRQLRTQVLAETKQKAFEQFHRQLYATCLDVLTELQQQSFFEQAAGREVLLFFSVSDGDTSAAELAHLAKQLNHNA